MKSYELKCRQKLKDDVMGYFESGADQQITLHWNENIFQDIKLLPRVLIDINNIKLYHNFFRKKVNLPFGIAPIAMQKLINKKGQLILIEQAKNRNIPFTLSLLSTTSIQQINKQVPKSLKILQLYFLKNNNYTKQIIQLAEIYKFQAIAITVDTQIFGKRRKNQKNKFQPKVQLSIFKELGLNIQFNSQNQNQSFIFNISNQLTWENIAWIKKYSKLKIILKGLINPDDVHLAHYYKIDAIWISNHGGRQLDTTPPTLSMLSSIRRKINELQSPMQLYIDGGIRHGSDIFKCLALGADYVFLGRGFLYSLIDGKQGVNNIFNILIHQLKTTMMLCGCPNINSITNNYIYQSKL